MKQGKRTSLTCFFVLIIAAIYSPSVFAKEALVLPFTSTHFPPYEFEVFENGLIGFDYEVVIESYRRSGVEIEVSFVPWNRALALVKHGKKAGLLTCAYTEDRAKYILFTDRISLSTSGVYSLKAHQKEKITTLEHLRGKDVRSPLGWVTEKELLNAGIEHRTTKDDKSALKDLLAGRFTYLYVTKETTDYLAVQMGVSDKLHFQPITQYPFFTCISKKWQGAAELVKKFNWGLQQIKEDGTYEKIHAKYQ
jgi:polar amino acid transport system substrate-binding protein